MAITIKSEREIQLMRESCKILAKVLYAIRKLEDASERVILIERYVNRKKWKDIYDEVYMSKTTCFRHHEHALEEIYDYIPQADLLEMTED